MRSPPKRQTAQLTLWVKPAVKHELQRRSKAAGLPVSRTGAAALEQWIAQQSHIEHRGIFQPMIEHAIAKEIRAYSSRIAGLEVRNLFIAEQFRAILYNLLREQPNMTEDRLNAIMDGSKDDAKRNIKRTDLELAPILPQIEHWLAQSEREA